ncbi:MAG: 2OG-Fe(II) oxygenase [Gammaproteobacteria bacterium]|nr:2OG-Fe(II) oxygenase [Gammaproteobacteria bacterium]
MNPNLDIQALAAEYDRDERIRIQDVFAAEFAEQVAAHCEQHVPYEYIFVVDGENKVATADEMRTMDSNDAQVLQSKIMEAAAEGVGFLYCGYMMGRARRQAESLPMQFLHSIFEYLNSEEMLSFVSRISGRDDLRSADGQFTRYQPGQFLTRHLDDITSEQRRLAYVFSFCRDWHPDWGGLLQFYEKDGTPRDAWAPGFNTLSLFDVRHVHSVTYVTPFAKRPRHSLTGWFRSMDGSFSG